MQKYGKKRIPGTAGRKLDSSQICGGHPVRLTFYYMCFASKPSSLCELKKPDAPFPWSLKGTMHCLFKLITLGNGKRHLQNTLSSALSSKALFFFCLFFAVVCLRWGRGERNQKYCSFLTLVLWFCPFHIYSTSEKEGVQMKSSRKLQSHLKKTNLELQEIRGLFPLT